MARLNSETNKERQVRSFAVLAVAALVLNLAACGKKEADTGAEQPAPAATNATAEPTWAVGGLEDAVAETGATAPPNTADAPDTVSGVYVGGHRYAQIERDGPQRLRFFLSAPHPDASQDCSLGDEVGQPLYAQIEVGGSSALYEAMPYRLRFYLHAGSLRVEQQGLGETDPKCDFAGVLLKDASVVSPNWDFEDSD